MLYHAIRSNLRAWEICSALVAGAMINRSTETFAGFPLDATLTAKVHAENSWLEAAIGGSGWESARWGVD